ncbi:MAG: hypothetical protein GY943_28105 [Chloroflexi bacterium]|nr:hypothetical protein [Chloroflexota bacterium]
MTETTGLLIGFILTLLIYSYLLGDNPLYRIAAHLLIGVSAAYAAVVILRQVLFPIYTLISQDPTNLENLIWFVPIFLALLLLLKRLPTISWLGNLSLALMVGVGAAVALTGAISGTLLPQVTVASPANPIFSGQGSGQGIVTAVLTACTLATFQFTGKTDSTGTWAQPGWQRSFGILGRIVITITFGALFAGVLNTSLILLSDRLGLFLQVFTP